MNAGPSTSYPLPPELEEGYPLTLLGAIYLPENGHILAVADRAASSWDSTGTAGGGGFVDKWMVVPGASALLWSWVGSEVIGVPFGVWLESEADTSSWDSFKAGASQRLKAFSTTQSPGKSTTEVCVAGFLAGVPGILHIQPYGVVNWTEAVPAVAPMFVGSSRFGVSLAWDFAEPHLGDQSRVEAFCGLFRLVIARDQLLTGFAAWDISPDAAPKRIRCENPPEPVPPPRGLSLGGGVDLSGSERS